MEIQQHIDAIKAKHEKLMSENPEISDITYTVRDIPYEEWDSFIKEYNLNDRMTPLEAGNVGLDLCFTMFGWHLDSEYSMKITFYSERVEIKTTIEVIKKVA